MNKSGIIIGIAVAITIIGFVVYSASEQPESDSVNLTEQPIPNPEGKQFTLELEDGISATGP